MSGLKGRMRHIEESVQWQETLFSRDKVDVKLESCYCLPSILFLL